MLEDQKLISLIEGTTKLSLRTEVPQKLLEVTSIRNSIIIFLYLAIFMCLPFVISIYMIFLFSYSLFASMPANMEALLAKLTKRTGNNAA